MSKKRKIVVTCLAIVLAVSLAVGGTITYLTGSSGEVKNEFTKNKNGVELDVNGDYSDFSNVKWIVDGVEVTVTQGH